MTTLLTSGESLISCQKVKKSHSSLKGFIFVDMLFFFFGWLFLNLNAKRVSAVEVATCQISQRAEQKALANLQDDGIKALCLP